MSTSSSRPATWAHILYGVIVFVLLLGQWRPLLFVDVSPEPWILVLSEAAAGKYRFGTDIVFTGGPLSDIYTRLFNPGTYASVLVVVYGLVTLQATAFAILAARSGSRFFQILLLPALFLIVARDVQVMLTPFLVALVVLGRPTGHGAVAFTIIGAVASAVSTLIKFSLFPLSIGLFLLVDLNRLRLRSIPVATACYAAAFYLSFALVAPGGSDFLAYFKGSLETSSGYAAAMAVAGPWVDAAVYAALMIAAVVSLIAIERRGDVGWSSAAKILATALFVWLTLKIGFVRHDLHILTAFAGLSLAVCAYGLGRGWPGELGHASATTITAVVLVASTYSYLKLAEEADGRFPLSFTLADSLTAIPKEVTRTVSALANPPAWFAERMSKREEERASMARASPVAGIDGTIDSIASLQSTLIAAGLAYRPRPTIQEYTTYTPALIKRNRAFFAGPAGPDVVLFEPVAIDGRYPALAEAASWPVFLSDYAPERIAGGGVLLRRRPMPLDDILGPGTSGSGKLGTPLPIDFGIEPLFIAIDVRPTLLGRIAEFLLKPSFLYLGVTTAGGPEQVYRLIPAIAREGFVASPVILTSQDYVRLAEGASAKTMQPVKTMRVFGGLGGNLAYASKVTYTVRRIDRARLAAGRNWSLPPDQAAPFDRIRMFESLIAASGGSVSGFQLIDEGLFAHAPRRLPVDVAGAEVLRLGFGLVPAIWGKAGESNGVCFRVLDAEGKTALWERCLDPAKIEADRAEFHESVALPPGTERVVLETDCRDDCRWDWSYWSDIQPTRR